MSVFTLAFIIRFLVKLKYSYFAESAPEIIIS